MAYYKKNKKRIDPRYFLNETTDRDTLEEDEDGQHAQPLSGDASGDAVEENVRQHALPGNVGDDLTSDPKHDYAARTRAEFPDEPARQSAWWPEQGTAHKNPGDLGYLPPRPAGADPGASFIGTDRSRVDARISDPQGTGGLRTPFGEPKKISRARPHPDHDLGQRQERVATSHDVGTERGMQSYAKAMGVGPDKLTPTVRDTMRRVAGLDTLEEKGRREILPDVAAKMSEQSRDKGFGQGSQDKFTNTAAADSVDPFRPRQSQEPVIRPLEDEEPHEDAYFRYSDMFKDPEYEQFLDDAQAAQAEDPGPGRMPSVDYETPFPDPYPWRIEDIGPVDDSAEDITPIDKEWDRDERLRKELGVVKEFDVQKSLQNPMGSLKKGIARLTGQPSYETTTKDTEFKKTTRQDILDAPPATGGVMPEGDDSPMENPALPSTRAFDVLENNGKTSEHERQTGKKMYHDIYVMPPTTPDDNNKKSTKIKEAIKTALREAFNRKSK